MLIGACIGGGVILSGFVVWWICDKWVRGELPFYVFAILFSLCGALLGAAAESGIRESARMDRIERACRGRVVCRSIPPGSWVVDDGRSTDARICGCEGGTP